MTYKDQLNRTITFNKVPQRIISLVPSQTELLVDLGLKDEIVGITKFCIHPKDLRKQKTIVGGTKHINFDKIKALKPDVILCNKEENTIDIIESLKDLAPIHISDIYTVEDCYALIKMYGAVFNVEERALELILNLEKEREVFQLQVKTKNKLKAAYFIWKNPWMVAASDTFIDTMLNEAGFLNIFKDDRRYPEISLSHPKLKDADLLMFSSEPFPFKQKHLEIIKSHLPDKKNIIVDGELFSWYGSRLLKSYTYFKTLHI
jgi:ABC-type Fe3+-hydroxamate transport system substrate-binding protein